MEGSVGKAQDERELDCDAAGRIQIQRSPLVCTAVHGNIVDWGELERNRKMSWNHRLILLTGLASRWFRNT
jgi:hypothetical protein